MVLDDAAREMMRLSRLIDSGVDMLRAQSHAVAEAEHAYRKAKAEAWVKAPTDLADGPREWTAARREAWVNADCADLRLARDIAEGVRDAAREAVRARQTQISALQTLCKAHQAEAEFARTGP